MILHTGTRTCPHTCQVLACFALTPVPVPVKKSSKHALQLIHLHVQYQQMFPH